MDWNCCRRAIFIIVCILSLVRAPIPQEIKRKTSIHFDAWQRQARFHRHYFHTSLTQWGFRYQLAGQLLMRRDAVVWHGMHDESAISERSKSTEVDFSLNLSLHDNAILGG